MKKKGRLGLLLIAMFLVACIGAAGYFSGSLRQQDSLTCRKTDVSPAAMEAIDYDVHLGKDVHGASIVAELWYNGICVKSHPLLLDSQASQLHISILADGFGTSEGTRGLNVQIHTDQSTDALLTYFDLPVQVTGYSFTAYDSGEVLPVTAGAEQILAAMAFDVGAGVSGISCASLLDDPERLTSASCLLAVRAAFTAEQPQETGPAQ